MFHFPEISASNKPRARQFSEAMHMGAILQFTLFINDFQKRVGLNVQYPILSFFRSSLARRGLLYSIMIAYWTGKKLNLAAECEAKGMDYSNALKTIREAKKAGYIDENCKPSQALEDEFKHGVLDALAMPKMRHLAASLMSSRLMGNVADEIDVAENKDGKKP
jgi:hypothetical protein